MHTVEQAETRGSELTERNGGIEGSNGRLDYPGNQAGGGIVRWLHVASWLQARKSLLTPVCRSYTLLPESDPSCRHFTNKTLNIQGNS